MSIIIPYRPRPQFLPYHASEKRFAVSVCHRRAGKTVARVNKLIRKACENERRYPPPRYGYLAPYFVQAKEIAWQYLKHYAAPLLDVGGKINESELSIILPHNGATVRLYGAENADRMRGLYFDGIVGDEAQRITRSTLTQIILPCLADYRGWLDISGTPRGWQNLLGEIVKLAEKEPHDWFLQIMRASESGIIEADELARQRALMSENEYAQEFECDFDAAITGAVYGKQIAQAAQEGRLLKLSHIADEPIHTAWDVGLKDSTAIWWWQRIRGELRVLDYYESFGQHIPHYCDVVKERGAQYAYQYGKHYVPHDAGYELLAAGGRSIVEQANALGVRMFAVPATSQQNGIEAARKTLESCYFDADRCERGLECLRQYQFEFDERLQTYRDKPRHDKFSHGADAFEIIAQVWRDPAEIVQPSKPRFLHEITFDELVASTPRHNHMRI